MLLTPREKRTLDELGAELAGTDRRLARKLSRSGAPHSTWRELAVITVLQAWMAAGLTPMALGVAWALPHLILVGVLTSFVAAPAGMWASLRWVRRHQFVSFRGGGQR